MILVDGLLSAARWLPSSGCASRCAGSTRCSPVSAWRSAGPAGRWPSWRRAFNEMLDRLEDERRDSARRALEAQEAERSASRGSCTTRSARRSPPSCSQLERRRGAGRPRICATSSTSCARRRARALEDVRRIAARLRPEALDDLGLPSALSRAARRRSATRRGSRSSAGSSATCRRSTARQELVDLPRRAGGADERRPPRATPTRVELAARPRRWRRRRCASATTAAGSPAGARVGERHPRHARARAADRRAAARRRRAGRRRRGRLARADPRGAR